MTSRTCPCCGRSEWRLIFNHARGRYLRCSSCGFQAQDCAATAVERFLQQQHNYYGNDAATLGTAHELLNQEVLTERVRVVDKYLRPGASVLEVGPGDGCLARRLQERGFSVTVVEQSESLGARLRDRGAFVAVGAFEELDLEPRRWDAFCSFHVIEHVPDVCRHLEKARQLVKGGGWAFIATPSADSWQHRLPLGLSPNFDAAHLHLFSRKSLALCLRRTGWTIVESLTPEYSTAWLRVATKIIRRLRGEDEQDSAGRYAGVGGSVAGAVVGTFSAVSRPWRAMQARLGRGNELFVVATTM